MTDFIEIQATGINNLKSVQAKLPLGKIICFTGKSGSGKSTLAFDVIYRASKAKVWKTPHYHVSELPDVYALQQKTRVSMSPVSVAKYLGLTGFAQKKYKLAECPHCHGTGVVLDMKPAIASDAGTLRKLSLIKELKPLISAIERRGDVGQVLWDTFQKVSPDEDMRNLFANIAEVKQCPHCGGVGVAKNLPQEDINAFFGRIVPGVFTSVETLDEVLDLFRPINVVGATRWQWIRLVKLLLELSDGGLAILDEPMAGMAASDALQMMAVVKRMVRAFRCSVILIEHAETAILESDYFLEMGPGAGSHGGEIVFSGPMDSYLKAKTQISKCFPLKRKHLPQNKTRRLAKVSGISEYGFKDETFSFPLLRLTCISGRTQTGKTGLLKVIARAFDKGSYGWCERLGLGDIQGRSDIRRLQCVSQNPIGNNPHSIPATYINAMTSLRTYFFESQADTKIPFEAFSFNSSEGCCKSCLGYGGNMVEDGAISRWDECAECGGNRYNSKVRTVKINMLNIGEFLHLTMQEVGAHKKVFPSVVNRTELIQKIGIGYLPLGQSSTTLSGGESQRIKLGKFLAKKSGDRTIYVLDNPSKGLSASDVPLLISVLHELAKKNTVVVADNHPLFVNECDHSVVLRKVRGRNAIVYSGSPSDMPSEMAKLLYRA